jgi:hypothetical protein
MGPHSSDLLGYSVASRSFLPHPKGLRSAHREGVVRIRIQVPRSVNTVQCTVYSLLYVVYCVLFVFVTFIVLTYYLLCILVYTVVLFLSVYSSTDHFIFTFHPLSIFASLSLFTQPFLTAFNNHHHGICIRSSPSVHIIFIPPVLYNNTKHHLTFDLYFLFP